MAKSFLSLSIVLLFVASCDKSENLVLKYPNGNVKAIWTYERDTLNGLKQIFWENGHRNSIFQYKNGKEQGRFKTFYENGFIAREGEFINGKLHGYHYRYSMSDSGQVATEEYIINANNKHYYFYIKNFNENGVLVDHQRFLIIELNERTVNKSVVFKYVGDVPYDSMKIISGRFSTNFEVAANEKLDTTNFVNNIAVVPLAQFVIDPDNYIRGKFLGYKSEQRGDTVTLRTMTQYYEQPLDSINKIGTEIILSNDLLSLSY